jgi:hypothetical protein
MSYQKPTKQETFNYGNYDTKQPEQHFFFQERCPALSQGLKLAILIRVFIAPTWDCILNGQLRLRITFLAENLHCRLHH